MGGRAPQSLAAINICFPTTGAALAAWSKYGIPVTLSIYLLGLVALIMFMVAIGPAVWTQDGAAFGEARIYAIAISTIAIPFASIFVAVYAWSFRSAQMASSRFKSSERMAMEESTATTQSGRDDFHAYGDASDDDTGKSALQTRTPQPGRDTGTPRHPHNQR